MTDVAIERLLRAGLQEGLWRNARLWIGDTDGGCVEYAVGTATWFDLASLTKPLVGAVLVGQALAQQVLDLDAPIGATLPSLEGGAHIRWVDLVSHHAGLVPYREWYRRLSARRPDAAGLWNLVRRETPHAPPGTVEQYSDTGYIVLGMGLRHVLGVDDLASAFAALLPTLPVAARDLAYAPPADAVVAATGLCTYRGRQLCGEVHDANTWHLGHLALHAGLFGTAASVGALAVAWLRATRYGLGPISTDVAARLLQPPPQIPGSTRPLAWDRPGPGPSQAGTRIGKAAFGHLGFTGTSVWADPERAAAVVLLTDRVAYDADGARFRAWRPRLHDAVWAALDTGQSPAHLACGSPQPIVVA